MYYKGFKIRLYPTKEQETLFWKHIGACRYIWNYMLELQETIYYGLGGKFLTPYQMNSIVTMIRKEEGKEWLNEISRKSLTGICQDLDYAYQRFFKGLSRHPKFKSKKAKKQSYPVRYDRFYFKDEKTCKIEAVGFVKCKTDFKFATGFQADKFTDIRVSYDNGKWFLSFGMECESQVFELSDKSMGIDLGIKELAVVTCGEDKLVYHNINKSKQIKDIEAKIKRLQRSICRKYEANKQGNKYVKTKNIEREEAKLRKLYKRLTGIRDNYLHQTTHELVSMNPKRIVMENLNVKGMVKNHHLAKMILDQKFFEFRRQIEYKCKRRGIEFVLADRFFPSSKMCSCCGHIKKDLKLSDRIYRCEKCGLVIDRDENAAKNLERYDVSFNPKLRS